jgi:hypothetical protein
VQEPRDFADHRAADSRGRDGSGLHRRICGSDHAPSLCEMAPWPWR